MLRLFVAILMNIRCCCEQKAAAYKTVLYLNHYSEAPGWDIGYDNDGPATRPLELRVRGPDVTPIPGQPDVARDCGCPRRGHLLPR